MTTTEGVADAIAQALYDGGVADDVVVEEDARFTPSIFRVELTIEGAEHRALIDPPEPFTYAELELLARGLRSFGTAVATTGGGADLGRRIDDLHDRVVALIPEALR